MAVSRHVLIRIPSIDWELMREQKAVLLELSDKHPVLEGVISMYDQIQDAAWATFCPVLWLEEATDD